MDESQFCFHLVNVTTNFKVQKLLSNYLSSLVLCQEVSDFPNSPNISPIVTSSHFTDSVLYTKQELEEYVGTLFCFHPDLFPFGKPASLLATQSTPNSFAKLVTIIKTN